MNNLSNNNNFLVDINNVVFSAECITSSIY